VAKNVDDLPERIYVARYAEWRKKDDKKISESVFAESWLNTQRQGQAKLKQKGLDIYRMKLFEPISRLTT